MAKGDRDRTQGQITQQSSNAQSYLDQLRNNYQNLAQGNSPGYVPTGGQQQFQPIRPQVGNVPSGIPGISSHIPSTGAPRQVSPQVQGILQNKFPQQYQGFTGTTMPAGGNNQPQQGSRYQGDPLQFIRQFQQNTPFGGVQSYQQLLQAMDQAGVPYVRPYRGQGMSGPQSDDKLVINGRMYDVGADTGWQLVDIGSAEEHGYGPGGDGVYRGQGGGSGGGNTGYLAGLQNALNGYNEFAQTGGYSEQDIQNLRNRAMAIPRAMFQLNKDELERHKNLSGGYMPNYAAALAKMNREQGYNIGNLLVNNEAQLADQIRSGRLAGMSGLANTGMGLGQQQLGLAGLQNQLGLGLIQAQLNQSQVPSDFSQIMGNIGQIGSIVAPFF